MPKCLLLPGYASSTVSLKLYKFDWDTGYHHNFFFLKCINLLSYMMLTVFPIIYIFLHFWAIYCVNKDYALMEMKRLSNIPIE